MMKNRSLLYSIFASLLIISFFFVLNFLTSWGHPWFMYPTFAVVWWPMGVFFGQNKKFKVFSVVATLWISAFFVVLNYITTPHMIWWIYPVFAALWWPLSHIICGAKKYKLYSVVMTVLTIAFFSAVNYLTSPNTWWFFYPAFAMIWWPMSQIICGAKMYKLYSIVASIYLIAFAVLLNFLYTPNYIWFYYPAFVILWWPLSMFFAKKKFIKPYSVIMSLFMVGFLALTNYLNTPDIWWFQYTIFYFLWWPVAMIAGKWAKTLSFAIISSVIIIAYHAFINLYLTPDSILWFLYMVLPVLWWPVSIAFKDKVRTGRFLIVSLIIFFAYYIVLNLIISPTFIWVPYVIYPAIWVVLGFYYHKKRKPLAFSLWATLFTIAFFVILNVIYTPGHIWAVYPLFAILWWPLSVYFYGIRKSSKKELAE